MMSNISETLMKIGYGLPKAREAWAARDLTLCHCDRMVEYCDHCLPPAFRRGGKFGPPRDPWDIE
jgi:hypothetical protein